MDRPTLVFPTPGAPTKHSIGPREGEEGEIEAEWEEEEKRRQTEKRTRRKE